MSCSGVRGGLLAGSAATAYSGAVTIAARLDLTKALGLRIVSFWHIARDVDVLELQGIEDLEAQAACMALWASKK